MLHGIQMVNCFQKSRKFWDMNIKAIIFNPQEHRTHRFVERLTTLIFFYRSFIQNNKWSRKTCIISLPYLDRRDLTPVHISLHTRFECCNVRNSHVRCRWVVSTVVEADDHDRQNSQSLRHLDDVSHSCVWSRIYEKWK